MRREGYLAQRLRLSVDYLDAARWTVAALVAAANDDRAGLETLAGLWAALVEARPQATLFRLTVSFDRFRPTDVPCNSSCRGTRGTAGRAWSA